MLLVTFRGSMETFDILSGSNYTRIAIDDGRPVDDIMAHYEMTLRESRFQEERKPFLLYSRET